MSISLKDLKKRRDELETTLEATKAELDLIRGLVSLYVSDKDVRNLEMPIQVRRPSGQTVSQAAKEVISEIGSKPFTVMDIVNRFFNSGFRKESELNSIRPTVSGILKSWLDKGLLERKNIGSDRAPVYEYWILDGKTL